MKIVSVLENPAYTKLAFEYVFSKWGNKNTYQLYKDNIFHCARPFPNWYLLLRNENPIGCAGLISNDFISRSDLYPWLCALYIEEKERGNNYGRLLIEKIKQDAASLNFSKLYLCTDHVGYYEKFGFSYLAQGYHPWGESSKIYEIELNKNFVRNANENSK
jgi:hypothetical protein